LAQELPSARAGAPPDDGREAAIVLHSAAKVNRTRCCPQKEMCLAGGQVHHDLGQPGGRLVAAVLAAAAQAESKGVIGCLPSLGDLELDKVVPEDVSASAPRNGARVFLQERQTRRCLTIVQSESGHERVVMTRGAVSLFECHRSDAGLAHPTVHSCAAVQPGMLDVFGVAEELADVLMERCNSGAGGGGTPVVSFAHEGLPGFGAFLSAGDQTWWQAWSRSGGVDAGMQCRTTSLGFQERFRWLDDGTVQHVPSGKWLYVDPTSPDEVVLHPMQRSNWEAMSAL